MKNLLRAIKQNVFHALKLYPIYGVINKINSHFSLKDCIALEAFAYTGGWQTRAYKHFPKYLEAWEIDPSCEAALHKNLPGATIKITNSFEEVLRCQNRFNFINVDTHQGIFGQYCENFEFFPLLFNVAGDEFIVNMNVIPHASQYWRKKYPDLFSPQHLSRRKEFYGIADPENISLNQMLDTYSRIAGEKGYKLIWHFYKQRTLTYYLVLHFKHQ